MLTSNLTEGTELRRLLAMGKLIQLSGNMLGNFLTFPSLPSVCLACVREAGKDAPPFCAKGSETLTREEMIDGT